MDQSMEALIQAVTTQVLAALEQENKLPDRRSEGKARCLVLGDSDHIPQALRRDAVLLGLEDYQTHQTITNYARVLITRLDFADLADIALGRGGTPAARAVCCALLQGTEVLLLECALPHRAFAGRGSTALYQLLERYVNTLQVFGVKLLGGGDATLALRGGVPEPKVPVRREVRDVCLITEALAQALAKDAQELDIPAGTLITPAAMDIFQASHTTLIRR